jgi:hypothetical protein
LPVRSIHQRFVRRVRGAQPDRVWRVEVEPGEELQVDLIGRSVVDTGVAGAVRGAALGVELFAQGLAAVFL